MQSYFYTARDERGKIVKGVISALDEVDLANKVSNLGYFLTDFKLSREGERLSKGTFGKLSSKEVLDITIQLATLIDAGVPLLQALDNLSKDAKSEGSKRVISDIRFHVESGTSLQDALSIYPHTFSKLYTAIVGAGEATGKLSQVLTELAGVLEWQMDLTGKIKEASIYPIILFVVMIGVLALLTGVVIPKFEPIFEQLSTALPLPTQIVLGLSHLVRRFWWIFLIIGGFFFGGYKFFNKREKGKYIIDSLKLKIPIFGILLRKIALSRFAHTFCLGFKAGIDLLTALEVAKGTCGNLRLERAVAQAKDAVNVGEKLATALEATGEFPPMVIRMIAVGEQSGALAQTLTKVSNFYDKEVTSTIRRLFALFEPMMIVFMGAVVGLIALSMFLPLFKMIQAVGG